MTYGQLGRRVFFARSRSLIGTVLCDEFASRGFHLNRILCVRIRDITDYYCTTNAEENSDIPVMTQRPQRIKFLKNLYEKFLRVHNIIKHKRKQ